MADTHSPLTIHSLPFELITKILRYLSPIEIMHCEPLSDTFREAAKPIYRHVINYSMFSTRIKPPPLPASDCVCAQRQATAETRLQTAIIERERRVLKRIGTHIRKLRISFGKIVNESVVDHLVRDYCANIESIEYVERKHIARDITLPRMDKIRELSFINSPLYDYQVAVFVRNAPVLKSFQAINTKCRDSVVHTLPSDLQELCVINTNSHDTIMKYYLARTQNLKTLNIWYCLDFASLRDYLTELEVLCIHRNGYNCAELAWYPKLVDIDMTGTNCGEVITLFKALPPDCIWKRCTVFIIPSIFRAMATCFVKLSQLEYLNVTITFSYHETQAPGKPIDMRMLHNLRHYELTSNLDINLAEVAEHLPPSVRTLRLFVKDSLSGIRAVEQLTEQLRYFTLDLKHCHMTNVKVECAELKCLIGAIAASNKMVQMRLALPVKLGLNFRPFAALFKRLVEIG